MRAGQKMTAKEARNTAAADRTGGTGDSSAQRHPPSTAAGHAAQRTDGSHASTRGATGAGGGGLSQRANPNASASQNPKGGAAAGKPAQPTPPPPGSLRTNRPTSAAPTSSTRPSTAKAPPPPQPPSMAVRGKVMTPANKYVHVPSNVLRSAPVSRVGSTATPAVAPSNPKKALSRDEFFGTGGSTKKTQNVKSVLHASKYFAASKKEDDRPREEGSVPPRSTTESNLTTASVAAETPTTSWTAACTGGGRAALVPVSSVESTTFEAMVLSEDADVAPRRSLSLSSNATQTMSASARRPPVDQPSSVTAAHASATTESPRHSGRGSGLIQWLLSPLLGRRPSGEERDERRTTDSNWERNNNHSTSTAITTATLSSFQTSNDSIVEVGRGSLQLAVPSAVPAGAGQRTKLSTDLPSRDTQRGSDVLSLLSETNVPSSPERKSASRASGLFHTPHFPPPPPNTPVGTEALRSDTPARRSLSLDMSSAARPSVGVPAAPPNTPVVADAADQLLLVLGSPPSQNDGAGSCSPRPPARSSTGWWPFSPTDQRDNAPRSGSGSMRESTEVHASASSLVAALEDTMPSSLSSTVFPTDDGREDAGRFSSVTGSWFGRIRNSLLLPMGSASQSTQRGERDDPASPPPTADESQPKRRKSVVFRSPEGLETRVEESFVVGSTTPSALPTHNVDASSPIPILLRSSSNRQEASRSATDQAPTTSGVGDVPRSDSPSRKEDDLAATLADAPARSDAGLKHAAASNESAQSPPPRPPAEPSLDSVSAVQPGPHDEPRHDLVRSHAVDRHGRVLRKSTPAPADLQSQLLSPPIPDSVTCSTSPPETSPLPPPAVDADHQRVAFVIRNHTVPSALRMLTVGDIAGFLVEHNVAFDPAEKKAKLFDVARRLVFADGSERSTASSTTRKRSREEGEERYERSLELPLEGTEEGLPTSAWTIADIRGYALSKGIPLPSGSVRKAELLRQVSASAGRSRSVSLALT